MKNSKNAIYNLIGVVGYSISQWVIISLISKRFNFFEIGNYSLYLAYLSPLTLLFGFHLRNYFNSTKDEITSIDIFWTRCLHTSIFFLCAMAFYFIKFDNLFFILLAISKMIDLLSEIIYSIRQKNDDIKYVGVSLLIKSIMISLFLFIFVTKPVDIYVLLILNSLIFFGIDFTLNHRSILGKIYFKKIKSISIVTLPLALSAVVTSININIPRYIIPLHLKTDALGIYTTIFFFYASFLVLANSVIQSYLGQLSNLFSLSSKHRYLSSKLLILFIILILSLCFGNYIFGDSIYYFVYGPKANDGLEFLFHLNYLIPLGLLSTFLNYLLLSLNQYKNIFKFTAISTIAHFIYCYILLSHNGLNGVFWALGLSQVTIIIFYIYEISKNRRVLLQNE